MIPHLHTLLSLKHEVTCKLNTVILQQINICQFGSNCVSTLRSNASVEKSWLNPTKFNKTSTVSKINWETTIWQIWIIDQSHKSIDNETGDHSTGMTDLAVFELSTTVTVLSWLTHARRLPEAEKETEWTQPPPPAKHRVETNKITRSVGLFQQDLCQLQDCFFSTTADRYGFTDLLLQTLLRWLQMASCCPRAWGLVSLPPP